MSTITFTTRVTNDGRIALPRDSRLAPGDLVHVTVTRLERSDEPSVHGRNQVDHGPARVHSDRSAGAEPDGAVLAGGINNDRR